MWRATSREVRSRAFAPVPSILGVFPTRDLRLLYGITADPRSLRCQLLFAMRLLGLGQEESNRSMVV